MSDAAEEDFMKSNSALSRNLAENQTSTTNGREGRRLSLSYAHSLPPFSLLTLPSDDCAALAAQTGAPQLVPTIQPREERYLSR